MATTTQARVGRMLTDPAGPHEVGEYGLALEEIAGTLAQYTIAILTRNAPACSSRPSG